MNLLESLVLFSGLLCAFPNCSFGTTLNPRNGTGILSHLRNSYPTGVTAVVIDTDGKNETILPKLLDITEGGYGNLSTGSSSPRTHRHEDKPFDWCDPYYTCDDQNNVLCEPPSTTSPCPHVRYEADKITVARNTVLAAINTFRDQLAAGHVLKGWPTAANMRQLVWDDILERQGAVWDLTCLDVDNPCPVHWRFGRSIGKISSKTEHWLIKDSTPVRNVHRMILEIHKAPLSIVNSYKAREDYKNFAQIVSAEASIIGCSMIRYLHFVGVVIVPLRCNLGPILQEGYKLYQKGEPCSKCPQETACNPNSTYKHLCAALKDPADGLFIPLTVSYNDYQDLSRSSSRLAPLPVLVFITIGLLSLVMPSSYQKLHRTD